MKVLHINTDASIGGAAIAARRHCEAMRMKGIDSKMLVFNNNLEEQLDYISEYHCSIYKKLVVKILNSVCNRIIRIFSKPKFGLFSLFYLGHDITKLDIVKNADIIYIHWINNNFLSMFSIKKMLKSRKKVIFYMHDMFPITGGCHHSFECYNYENNCKNCQLLGYLSFVISWQLKFKNKCFEQFTNLQIASPSKWLLNCSNKSSLFKDKAHFHCPNVVDTNFYKPINKGYAKNLLELDPDKKYILFVAVNIDSPYKGWNYLLKALEKIDDPNIEAIVVGNDSITLIDNLKINRLGFINDATKMKIIFNAASVLVIPSLAENFPNVVIEAMSCATPVVGFSIGGIKEQIVHMHNGWLSPPKQSIGLYDGIMWLINNPDYDMIAKNARNYVECNCSYSNVLINHKEILGL